MKKIAVNQVVEILNANIEDSPITTDELDTSLMDLGMDSITFIQVIVALEEEFECEIPDEKIMISEMDTVQKIINILQSLYDKQDNK